MARPIPTHLVIPPSLPSPFKLDEGYSEDLRSLDGLDDHDLDLEEPTAHTQLQAARDWLHSQPAKLRADLARELLLSLPNALISQIVRDADQRLHFDPILCLPHEIISYIFHFLDPPNLLNAALVSRAWKTRALDPSLWRRLFLLEGWTTSRRSTHSLTHAIRGGLNAPKGKTRARSHGPVASEPAHKRLRDTSPNTMDTSHHTLFSTTTPTSTLPDDSWAQQSATVEADEDVFDVEDRAQNQPIDHVMHDMPIAAPADVHMDPDGAALPASHSSNSLPTSPGVDLVYDVSDETPRLNWLEIYHQRRRLESNWEAARYTNFCLPHPDYPHEAHSQCVYTIQYSNTHLVSGGRDKTVRVWDLETQRLKLPPLLGHNGSVLCLQFDDRPEQDVIVSGGSDSDIIVWRMSTGVMLRKLSHIHTEPVLNLRFDDRYLVTCSKDKTIKVLNRRDLLPTDPEYPRKRAGVDARYPDYIFELESHDNFPDSRYFEPVPSYSILMTFEGHKAAVNAIQIHENEIISASGDRTCMLWDMSTGCHVKTFGGHSKGIACVQYDGRRIVSGSSDFTVRIFDRETGAELYLLEGHRDLVRTVQAQFADVPGDEEAAREEAREHDRRVLEDRRRRMRNSHFAWAPMPSSHFVTGAKLPPGGGGNRWSKIVSGSYDESVIIWRKDKSGRWFIAKELRQDEALRTALVAAAARTPTEAGRLEEDEPSMPHSRMPEEWTSSARQGGLSRPDRFGGVVGFDAPAFAPAHNNNSTPRHPMMHASQASISPSQFSPSTHAPTAAQTSSSHRPSPSQALPPPSPMPRAAQSIPQHLHSQSAQFQPPTQRLQVQAQAPQQQQTSQQQQQQQQQQHQQHQHQQAQGGANSRIFKLQFDARRIVCCSQEPVIVGWDFANGDKDIIAACQFFGEPTS